jgi:hypothetical protein
MYSAAARPSSSPEKLVRALLIRLNSFSPISAARSSPVQSIRALGSRVSQLATFS